MTLKDVLTLPIEPYMAREVKWLRRNTPRFLKTIIEQTFEFSGIKSLTELTQKSLLALEGGVSSAVYLVKKAEDSFVIKLRYQGISAEVEAMNAWQSKGASVVAIKQTGFLKNPEQTVKYLIQEGIMRRNGSPAPTAVDFLKKNPKRAYELGKLRGEELAKMHKAKTSRTFGEFADMEGKKAPFKSWNSYLLGYIDYQRDLLKKAGLNEDEIKGIKKYVQKITFPKKGVYLHGDFSSRNILVESSDPLAIRVFDPNPLVGYPGWDIAFLFNNYEIAKKRHRVDPRNKDTKKVYQIEKDMLHGFIEGYELISKQKIDRKRLYPHQLILAALRLDAEISKAKKKAKNYWDDIEVMSTKNTLLDAASFMLLYN